MYSLHTNSKYWNGFVDIKQTNKSIRLSNIMLKESKAHENTFHFPFWFWKVPSILSVGLELTYMGYFAWFDMKGEVEWNNQGNHLHVIWVKIVHNLDIFLLEDTVLNMIAWNFGVCSKSESRFLQRRRRQYLEDLAFSSGSRIYIKRCICLADKAGWLPSGFAEIWHFMQRLFRGRLLWNTGNGKSLDCGKTIPRSSTASKFSSLDKDRKRWNSINYFLDKKSADIQRGSCRVRVQTFSQANCSVLTANSFKSLFF